MTNFKVGQLARSRVEGKVIQIRRIKFKDGERMLGVGRIAFTWVLLRIMISIEVLVGISYINQITTRLRPDHLHDRGFFISVK